jgi:hypothetical protein
LPKPEVGEGQWMPGAARGFSTRSHAFQKALRPDPRILALSPDRQKRPVGRPRDQFDTPQLGNIVVTRRPGKTKGKNDGIALKNGRDQGRLPLSHPMSAPNFGLLFRFKKPKETPDSPGFIDVINHDEGLRAQSLSRLRPLILSNIATIKNGDNVTASPNLRLTNSAYFVINFRRFG